MKVIPKYIGESNYTLELVTPNWIKPYFGYASSAKNTIYINSKLPKIIQESVRAHEEYHLFDKLLDSYWAREKRAWIFQWKRSKVGTILTILYSLLLPYRIKLYIDLYRNKQIKPRVLR